MSREPPLGRESFRSWRRIETRWSDNDQYGHVNNTVFYEWFDTAVNGWLINQGLLRPGGADDVIALVVETGCSFFKPISYPDAVDVAIAAERIGSSSVTYRIGIFAEGRGEAAAQGRFVHVCVDAGSRRPVPIPAAWRERLQDIATPG